MERVFVKTAIKRALCREGGPGRVWVAKIRPRWGHNDHPLRGPDKRCSLGAQGNSSSPDGVRSAFLGSWSTEASPV
jgi:murein endopeptidase